jgi:hypothetical protein
MRRCDGGQWGVRAIIVEGDRRRNDLDGRHNHATISMVAITITITIILNSLMTLSIKNRCSK